MEYLAENKKLRLADARNYEDLADIAFSVLTRMPKPVGQVCGPISTGGKGNIEENTKVFRFYIDTLIERGLNIFNQLPFQDPMVRLIRERQKHGDYDHALLHEFYGRIFRSGHLSTLYFIPGWGTSTGASWEHGLGRELGLRIEYLPELPLL